jgi:hypothetical protein
MSRFFESLKISAERLSMRPFDRRRFDHVGIPTSERHPGERWVEATRVWVTSPRDHPFNVEWLRFEADSPVVGPLRTQPHVAYRVEDMTEAIKGRKVVLAPFEVGNGFVKVAFVEEVGAIVELMEYKNPDEEGWF